MPHDPQLDAQLRDVPLPGGMIERLKSSLAPSEAEVEQWLLQVEVPAELLAQLGEIPADETLDEALRDVPAPFELVFSARRPSWTSRTRRAIHWAGQLALSLLLFLAVGSGLTAATGAFLASIYPQSLPPSEPPFVVVVQRPVQLAAHLSSGPVELIATPPSAAAEEIAAAPSGSATRRDQLDIDSPETNTRPDSGPVQEWFIATSRGIDPWDNIILMRWGILGYPQFDDAIAPALEAPQFPRPAGMEPPAVRGYDRSFVLRHGVFPPVRPAASGALQTVALPLVVDSTSHEYTQWLCGEGRWPAPSQVRTEEFLAAMDYRLAPAAAGELAIRTAAGPSVFGPPATGLVQIAAVAGALPREEDETHHLVIALDASASMARGHRLEIVRKAIERLLARLDPRDRLSLIVFQDDVRYQVERASDQEREAIGRALAELRPAGGTDLAEGLQQAVAAAVAPGETARHPARIALITDSQVTMPAATLAAVTEMLSTAAQAGVGLDVLDVSDEQEIDPTLAQWAATMRGDVRRPHSVDAAARLLADALAGRSTVVASEARLNVRFNREAVAAYRLIGHEPNAMAALRPPSLAAELRALDAATTLLEIWFQPNDENDVGLIELTWRDPASGQEHRRTQRISRIQFAPSWEQSPISLQQAAIAAQTAEILRGSRAALRELGQVPQTKESIAGLLETTARVHPQLAGRPEFQEWLALLAQLEKTAP